VQTSLVSSWFCKVELSIWYQSHIKVYHNKFFYLLSVYGTAYIFSLIFKIHIPWH